MLAQQVRYEFHCCRLQNCAVSVCPESDHCKIPGMPGLGLRFVQSMPCLQSPGVIKLWRHHCRCCCCFCCSLSASLRPHPDESLPQVHGVGACPSGLDAAHVVRFAGLGDVCRQADRQAGGAPKQASNQRQEGAHVARLAAHCAVHAVDCELAHPQPPGQSPSLSPSFTHDTVSTDSAWHSMATRPPRHSPTAHTTGVPAHLPSVLNCHPW
jgi:hypothetical protein